MVIQTFSKPSSSRRSNCSLSSWSFEILLEGRIRSTAVISPFFSMASVRIQDWYDSKSGASFSSEILLFVACHAILTSDGEEMFPFAAFWMNIIGGATRNADAAHMKRTIDGGIRNRGSSTRGYI